VTKRSIQASSDRDGRSSAGAATDLGRSSGRIADQPDESRVSILTGRMRILHDERDLHLPRAKILIAPKALIPFEPLEV